MGNGDGAGDGDLIMSEMLQVQISVDENAARQYGRDYERSIERSASLALAEEMIKSSVVKHVIVDPGADEAEEYARYKMRRYYRFSVMVGDKFDTKALAGAEEKGRNDALSVIRHLLKQPNDYEGDMRGHFLRWLERMSPEIVAFEAAKARDDYA